MKTTDISKMSSLEKKARTSVLEVIVPVEKAAKFLKLGRSSVYRLAREGRLDKVKLGSRIWIVLGSISDLKKARGVEL